MLLDTEYLTNYQSFAGEMGLNDLPLLCDPISIKYMHSEWHSRMKRLLPITLYQRIVTSKDFSLSHHSGVQKIV